MWVRVGTATPVPVAAPLLHPHPPPLLGCVRYPPPRPPPPHHPLTQSNTLAPYLSCVRSTLDAALCLRNFPSQHVERHNKPEVEMGCVSGRTRMSVCVRVCARAHRCPAPPVRATCLALSLCYGVGLCGAAPVAVAAQR